ncbi:hypothetical protein [Stenotrophomonas maltophilia]|uniref:hypothetical protein n=1 Tax=Stenotrophomonas maltophilia TaxID=40324 RepID=UPI003BA22FBB
MLTKFNISESAANFDPDLICTSFSGEKRSAIDAFYETRDLTLTWLFSPPFSDNPSLRANLLLLLFSSAETYFRRVIGEAIALCPFAAEHSGGQQIALGSVAMFGSELVGFSISDTKGLTSAGEIASRTSKLLGLPIDKNSSLGVAISQFESICVLRHAIVHSSCELLYSNRKELKVKHKGRLVLSINDAGAQEIVQIAVNAVRSYNNRIGNELIRRWFTDGHFTGTWRDDRDTFCRATSLFRSKVDELDALSDYKTYLSLRKSLRANKTLSVQN